MGTSSPEGVKVSCSIALMGENTAVLKYFQERRGKAMAQPLEISSLILSLIHSTSSSRILLPFFIARLKSSSMIALSRSWRGHSEPVVKDFSIRCQLGKAPRRSCRAAGDLNSEPIVIGEKGAESITWPMSISVRSRSLKLCSADSAFSLQVNGGSLITDAGK